MTQEPATRRARRELERQQRGPVAAVAVVLVALLGVGAAVWFGTDLFDGSPTAAPVTAPASTQPPTTSSAPLPSTPSSEATTSATPTVDPVAAKVEQCRSGWQLQAKAARAAATSLREWDKHLDIMNALQAGKISLARAKKDWAPTTAQAPQHIAAFHAADRAYRSAKQGCTPPTGVPASEQTKALSTCATGMRVVNGILGKARAAIEPWETHLKDQSHFKGGDISAARAEALWRSLWQQGLKRNPPYFKAVSAGAKATCPIAG